MNKRKEMFKNILAEMARNSLKRSELANILNVTEHTLRKKLSGEQDFKFSEIETMLQLFKDVNYEYLFKKSEQTDG